jgi:hypothetical protein
MARTRSSEPAPLMRCVGAFSVVIDGFDHLIRHGEVVRADHPTVAAMPHNFIDDDSSSGEIHGAELAAAHRELGPRAA